MRAGDLDGLPRQNAAGFKHRVVATTRTRDGAVVRTRCGKSFAITHADAVGGEQPPCPECEGTHHG
ncbi:hypothetical protein [Amycolatopsis anabasis]|uniref:hypothetical protein n=1 Tax=Amycolatopsis anabasis TaxID=1840409 RepID=UPI00131E3C53|nr:hypothetical protein [Amycolatopsis anabasis]